MPSNFGEDAITAELFSRLAVKHRFCVDIGAADGVNMSNTHCLFAAGWSGLCVEADPERFAALAVAYRPARNARLVRNFVTPVNVVSLFEASGVPQDFDFLSLDIDGYDYFVLEQILEKYRPTVVLAEINEKIPPPIRFTVKWDANYGWSNDHLYGQSIAQIETLCRRFEYEMVRLEYHNLFCVARERNNGALPARNATELYQSGYVNRPDRLQKMPWNADMEQLLTLGPAEGVAFVNNYFAKYAGKYVCEL
jgi:hypothetical protein